VAAANRHRVGSEGGGDGYTILVISSTLVVNPSLFASSASIPRAISRRYRSSAIAAVLLVHPSVPAASVRRSSPGESQPGSVQLRHAGLGHRILAGECSAGLRARSRGRLFNVAGQRSHSTSAAYADLYTPSPPPPDTSGRHGPRAPVTGAGVRPRCRIVPTLAERRAGAGIRYYPWRAGPGGDSHAPNVHPSSDPSRFRSFRFFDRSGPEEFAGGSDLDVKLDSQLVRCQFRRRRSPRDQHAKDNMDS